MIMIIAHQSPGALYCRCFNLGPNVDGMNLSTELLSDQNSVIQNSEGLLREIHRHENCFKLHNAGADVATESYRACDLN